MTQFGKGFLVGLVPFLGLIAGLLLAFVDGQDILRKGIDTPTEYNPAQWFYEDRQNSAGTIAGAIIQLLAFAACKIITQ